MTAFATLPHHFFALFEDLLHFNVVEQLQEAFFVSLFDGAHSTELRGEFCKAFGLGRLCKTFVHVRPFVVFTAGGSLQIFGRVADALQVLEPDLGVLAFVGSRFVKKLGDLLIAFLAGNTGKVVVLVASLRLTGKRSPEVLFGLGACKLLGHRNISLLCIRGFI